MQATLRARTCSLIISAHGAFDESLGTADCDRAERIAYLVARVKLLAQFMQVGRLAKGVEEYHKRRCPLILGDFRVTGLLQFSKELMIERDIVAFEKLSLVHPVSPFLRIHDVVVRRGQPRKLQRSV